MHVLERVRAAFPDGMQLVSEALPAYREKILALLEEETRRCVGVAQRLQDNASCKTVRKTCQAIIDRILGGE